MANLKYLGAIYPYNEPGFTSALNATATIDLGSIANAAQEVVQITSFTGASLGDKVFVTADIDQAGLTLTGYVSAADTVEVVALNLSGGAVDLASATFNIKVMGMK